MAVNYFCPAGVVSDDLLTYEVEEVAERASVAVVGEGGEKTIHSLSGGAHSHRHLVCLEHRPVSCFPGALVWLASRASG